MALQTQIKTNNQNTKSMIKNHDINKPKSNPHKPNQTNKATQHCKPPIKQFRNRKSNQANTQAQTNNLPNYQHHRKHHT